MAIAFDTTSEGTISLSSSLTVAHTCTGSYGMLIVAFTTRPSGGSATDVISSVTYNGVSMTRAISNAVGTDHRQYIYYLVAPATGASYNIVITTDGTNATMVAKNASYTGVKQGSQPDASTTPIQQSSTPLTVSITTVLANCWQITLADQNSNLSANSGCVRRTTLDTTALFDSNAALSAGSHSMSINGAGGGTVSGTSISIAPLVTNTISVSDTSSMVEGALKRNRIYLDTLSILQSSVISMSDTISLVESYFSIKKTWKSITKNISSWISQNKS
jgi:hypothetical protein